MKYIVNFLHDYPRSPQNNAFVACTLTLKSVVCVYLSSFKTVSENDTEKWVFTSDELITISFKIARLSIVLDRFSVTLCDGPDISPDATSYQKLVFSDLGTRIGKIKCEVTIGKTFHQGAYFPVYTNPKTEGPFIGLYAPFTTEELQISPDGTVNIGDNVIRLNEETFAENNTNMTGENLVSNEKIIF